MKWDVPLCQPALREEGLAALQDAYRSGWLTVGPRTAELEHAFREYTGAAYALPVSSCSAGLHLACLAAGFRPGDEVIAPSLTFTSTVSAIVHAGGSPRFADIASITEPWLSAAAVEAAITPRTRGILTMSYGGHVGEAPAIAALARERGLVLIEDVAHAAGSRHEGRHLGTFGSAGCFSFSASKNLGIGEGGMLITDDPEIADRVSRQSWHGLASQPWERHHQPAPSYELGALGFNYRFDDPRAALVRCSLEHLDQDICRRFQIDAFYREAFADSRVQPTAPPGEGQVSSHCLFTVVLDPAVDRDRFRERLADDGVQSTVHYPLLHRTGALAQEGVRLPLSEEYARRCVTLPLFPQMEHWQRDLVVESALRAAADRSLERAAAA